MSRAAPHPLRALLGRLAGAPAALHRDEGGAAMVEFVIVFPAQLLLSLILIQWAYLANAVTVVNQAAFLAARAAAVADGMDGVNAQDAARRSAARTLAALTSSYPSNTPGSIPSNGRLSWPAQGGRLGYSQARQQQAYGHLEVRVHPHPQDGYVSCEVIYDYVMAIPVANNFFARGRIAEGGFFFGVPQSYNPETNQRRLQCFRIHRVGFISTPWTRGPQ